MLAKTKKLSKSIKSFDIRLARVAYLNQFFRSLFILVDKEKELIKNHEIARRMFSLPKNKKFMPHLSLVYGDFRTKTKKEMIKKIGTIFNISFEVNNICLVCNNEKSIGWTIIRKFNVKN